MASGKLFRRFLILTLPADGLGPRLLAGNKHDSSVERHPSPVARFTVLPRCCLQESSDTRAQANPSEEASLLVDSPDPTRASAAII